MTSHFDIHELPAVSVHFLLISMPPTPSAYDESDDLDDLLDETGATVHRSTGKTGTDTEAEPDPKPKPSAATQADQSMGSSVLSTGARQGAHHEIIHHVESRGDRRIVGKSLRHRWMQPQQHERGQRSQRQCGCRAHVGHVRAGSGQLPRDGGKRYAIGRQPVTPHTNEGVQSHEQGHVR